MLRLGFEILEVFHDKTFNLHVISYVCVGYILG